MQLKRLYDHDAPQAQFERREEMCRTCSGKGVVVNDAGDGIVKCPGTTILDVDYPCEGGLLIRMVPPVRGVVIQHAGKRQHFTPDLIETASAQGWLKVDGGKLTITGFVVDDGVEVPANVTYVIERKPGHYCCHCGAALSGESAAKLHVGTLHKGEDSPDDNNPAGYRRDNFYACVQEQMEEVARG